MHCHLAVMFGLLAWLLLLRHVKQQQQPVYLVLGVALLTMSLLVKHVLFLFPVWLLLWRELGPLKKRVLICLIPYAIFMLSFLPYVQDPAGFQAVKRFVLEHSPNYNQNGLIHGVLNFLVPPQTWTGGMLAQVPVFAGVKLVWITAMMLFAVPVMRYVPEKSFFYYLLVLLVFVPGLWIHHLGIAAVASGVFYKRWEYWMYFGIQYIVIFKIVDKLDTLFNSPQELRRIS